MTRLQHVKATRRFVRFENRDAFDLPESEQPEIIGQLYVPKEYEDADEIEIEIHRVEDDRKVVDLEPDWENLAAYTGIPEDVLRDMKKRTLYWLVDHREEIGPHKETQ